MNGVRSTGLRTTVLKLGPLLILLLSQAPLAACTACFGQTDSRMAQGMNMGIFVLLAVITTVLAGVASFFVYLGRRVGQAQPPVTQPDLNAEINA